MRSANITAEWATRLPAGRVVGIDDSSEMIEYARAAFPPERYPNLAIIKT
jgi:trans-aconitate methyltransferase